MAARSRAVSHRSRCAAMTASPWVMRRRRVCDKSERTSLSGVPPRLVERKATARLRLVRRSLEPVTKARVAAIIPVLDEQGAIASVLAAIPRGWVDQIIVVDGGSRDRTVAVARAAGA